MERNVSVRTPEAIAFYYELAGLGSRFLAVAIDTVVQIIAGIALLLVWIWATPAAQATATALHLSGDLSFTILYAIVILLLFLLYTGYFIAFEVWWNGQTLGKRLIGIRTVRDGGYPVTFMASVIRNLVRVLESAFVYLPSIVSALASSQNKRLGDLAAGTIVVRDRAFEAPDPVRWMAPEASIVARLPGLERITADEFALAERYVTRSHMLDPEAAQETAGRIAAAVRPKLGPEASRLSDHELLVRLAAARPR